MKPLPRNASFTTYTIKHADTDAAPTNTKVLDKGKKLDVSRRYAGDATDVATAYKDGNYSVEIETKDNIQPDYSKLNKAFERQRNGFLLLGLYFRDLWD